MNKSIKLWQGTGKDSSLRSSLFQSHLKPPRGMPHPGNGGFQKAQLKARSCYPERKRARALPLKTFPRHLNKRAMMDDLFDFLFTVLIGFFVLFFINGVLERGIQASHSQTRSGIAEFHERASAITHLAIQAQQPVAQGEIRVEQLDQKLGESSVVGGKQITICEDYETKVDCENDLLNAGIDGRCKWKKTKCVFQPAALKLQ